MVNSYSWPQEENQEITRLFYSMGDLAQTLGICFPTQRTVKHQNRLTWKAID